MVVCLCNILYLLYTKHIHWTYCTFTSFLNNIYIINIYLKTGKTPKMVFVLRKFKNLKTARTPKRWLLSKKTKIKNRKNTKMVTLKNGKVQENRKNTKIVIALRQVKNIKNRENIKMVLALRQSNIQETYKPQNGGGSEKMTTFNNSHVKTNRSINMTGAHQKKT